MEGMTDNIVNMLKRAARDRHRPIRLIAISTLFKILDKFQETKNAAAPAIYKTLIYSLCENPQDSTTRQLYLSNFTSLYESNQTIPIGLLVEPFIKQI